MRKILLISTGLMMAALQSACGGGGSSSLTVSISPSNPLEADFQSDYDGFTLTASVSEKAGFSYSYQWYKNDAAISGATSSVLASSQMADEGHTVRGYEFKCEVTSSNSETGEAAVTIEGPNLSFDRGVLFHNIFRYYALNEGANSSITNLQNHTSPNWISIGVLYFQSDANSTTIYEKTDEDRNIVSTLTESDLISQIQYAHDAGLSVMLYPEIWIDGYSPGPRDEITGTASWFAAYQAVIEDLAGLAETYDVEMFCVGVELVGTEDQEERWRNLIQAVRNIYSGSVIYSTTYPAGIIDAINWWDALDYIGVTCNFGTWSADPDLGTNPTLTQFENIYADYRDVLETLSISFNKSVFITEAGTYSADGGTINHTQYSSTADQQEQADFFEALFQTFAGQSWVSGLVVLDWFPTQENWYQDDSAWPLNTSIINKNAEKVIESWFSQ